LFPFPAEQSDEHKCQLEKERNLRHEEDTKGLGNVKLEAELRGHDLEARGRKIEAVVAKVIFSISCGVFCTLWNIS